MKKLLFLLCCFVCVFSLLCFSSCDSSTGENGVTNTTDESISDNTDNIEKTEDVEVVITLTSDIAEVAPGEEFTVTCTVKECQLFAAGDLVFAYNNEQLTAELVEENVKDMYSFSNKEESACLYSAYTLSTINIENAVFFSVHCVADESCKSGDEIEITLSCDDWLIGVDETGDDVISIADSVITNSLLIKVK